MKRIDIESLSDAIDIIDGATYVAAWEIEIDVWMSPKYIVLIEGNDILAIYGQDSTGYYICEMSPYLKGGTLTDNGRARFYATVTEIGTSAITVSPLEGFCERVQCGTKIVVSTDTPSAVIPDDIKVGDTVCITYDGNIAETYFPQIRNVYEISIYEQK